jgi:UDP-N-acetylmuramoyl-L-alanyl-D-glutamate--2,6-diaminopimelate ligase
MGEIAGRLSDLAIVTSDNPRSEDPEAILAEVLVGMDGAQARIVSEVDRRRAIALAIEAAGAGDVVVIAGKGHERGQEFADGHKIDFDDATVAREMLHGVSTGARSR